MGRCTKANPAWRCKNQAGSYKHCAKHRGPNWPHSRRREAFAQWIQTEAGIAWGLRNAHKYPADEARTLARRLKDPKERCEICGIPASLLPRLGKWMWGKEIRNRRLTPDNMSPREPHRLETTRLLCLGCNTARATRNDATTLAVARRHWLKLLNLGLLRQKDLWWMR